MFAMVAMQNTEPSHAASAEITLYNVHLPVHAFLIVALAVTARPPIEAPLASR